MQHEVPMARASEAVAQRVRQAFHSQLLTVLLCTDGVFCLLQFFGNTLAFAPDVHLALSKDGGYPEMFQYLKEFLIASVLFAVFLRSREVGYGVWALLFLYLLCDDALGIHEGVGTRVSRHWNLVPALGLRAQDLGELAVSLAVGVVFLVPMTYCYFHSKRATRIVVSDLALLLGLLAFFGVFFDMVHSGIGGLFQVRGLGTIEDGGEMAAMSLIAGYVVNIPRRPA